MPVAALLLVLTAFACSLAIALEPAQSVDEADFSAADADDVCSRQSPDDSGKCSLSMLQLRGVKVAGSAAASSPPAARERLGSEPDPPLGGPNATVLERQGEQLGSALAGIETRAETKWSFFRRRRARAKTNPINAFNNHLDTVKFVARHGLFYEFETAESQVVWSGEIEGLHDWADKGTAFPLASASKLFTAFACMYTMQLKPRDWYPTRYMHEFRGWEDFRDFAVHGTPRRASLTVHNLLTHTSGLPFGIDWTKDDIRKATLFFEPGTQFGYTLGHRVIGWMLRDYWRDQPEARYANIQTVQDTFKWLFFDKLGLSTKTHFSEDMSLLFGFEGQAGDAAIQSTGADLMKLAVVALRRGTLPSGEVLISKANWDKWAVPNLLPGGKLTKDLVHWESHVPLLQKFGSDNLREQIMQQHGNYGWNYFGATYSNSKEIGWCGFFSSCLRVTYQHDLAFVMMQRDVADLKKSKPYMDKHFSSMAKWLQCKGAKSRSCARPGQSAIFCEVSGEDQPWTSRCPSSAQRGKGWGASHRDERVQNDDHTCYIPSCDASARMHAWR